ncbi:MAG TPA: copper chaperone PCu(A)C [Rhizomicrobium sp.]|nr:copper chaperone PCu(A)C [Rhizomicrobium sp.]
MRVKPLEIAVVALLFPACALAGPVLVSDAWMRALPAGLPAAGYFTLHNTSSKEVALTGAASSACGMLMLHKSSEQGSMGSMQDVTSVAVPAGGTVKFAPGGYHLMCMNPVPALKPGASVGVTLTFSDGSRSDVPFAVKNAQGK